MSADVLDRFYHHLQGNPALEIEAFDALRDGPAAVVALGRREGFSFSEEQLSDALSRKGVVTDGELSDQDLDLVAGGIEPRGKNDSSNSNRSSQQGKTRSGTV